MTCLPRTWLQGVRVDFHGVWRYPALQPAVPWEPAGWPSALSGSCVGSVHHSRSILLFLCPFFHSLVHSFVPLHHQAYDPFTSGFSHPFCVNLVLPSVMVSPSSGSHFLRHCVLRGSFVHLAPRPVPRLFTHVFVHSAIGHPFICLRRNFFRRVFVHLLFLCSFLDLLIDSFF